MLVRRTIATITGAFLGLAVVGGSGVGARAPEPAGSPALSIQAALGAPCIRVYPYSGAAASDEIQVQQKRNGSVISTRSAPFTIPIESVLCLKPLQGGDTLLVTHGSRQRTVPVPTLTASLNLATDTIAGTATGATSVTVMFRSRVGPIEANLWIPDVVAAVDENGAWSGTAEADIRRGDRVVVLLNVGIDRWRLVPSSSTLAVRPGSAVVTGTAPVNSRVSGTLTAPDGTVRGRFKAKTSTELNAIDSFTGTFKTRAGKAVKVRVGDRVSFSGIRGTFTVPGGTLKQTSSDTVATKCSPGARWMAAANGSWFTGGTADDAGTIADVNVSDVVRGATVTLACEARSGWRIVRAVVLQ